jgi:hypothetical protein
MRAALIYQHATSARDRSIATALSGLVATERQTTTKCDEANEGTAAKRMARPERWSRWPNGTLMARPENGGPLTTGRSRRFGW